MERSFIDDQSFLEEEMTGLDGPIDFARLSVGDIRVRAEAACSVREFDLSRLGPLHVLGRKYNGSLRPQHRVRADGLLGVAVEEGAGARSGRAVTPEAGAKKSCARARKGSLCATCGGFF